MEREAKSGSPTNDRQNDCIQYSEQEMDLEGLTTQGNTSLARGLGVPQGSLPAETKPGSTTKHTPTGPTKILKRWLPPTVEEDQRYSKHWPPPCISDIYGYRWRKHGIPPPHEDEPGPSRSLRNDSAVQNINATGVGRSETGFQRISKKITIDSSDRKCKCKYQGCNKAYKRKYSLQEV